GARHHRGDGRQERRRSESGARSDQVPARASHRPGAERLRHGEGPCRQIAAVARLTCDMTSIRIRWLATSVGNPGYTRQQFDAVRAILGNQALGVAQVAEAMGYPSGTLWGWRARANVVRRPPIVFPVVVFIFLEPYHRA